MRVREEQTRVECTIEKLEDAGQARMEIQSVASQARRGLALGGN